MDAFVTWSLLEDEQKPCTYYQQFAVWTAPLCQEAETLGTRVAIDHAKLSLLDKYFAWCALVPKRHRNHIGDKGHLCIFSCFEQAYRRLIYAQLSLEPPSKVDPPAPPAPS